MLNTLRNFIKSKKNIILLCVLTLSIITLTLSFAFFAISDSIAADTDIGFKSSQLERLTFNTDGDIFLHATQENFVSGGGSLSSSSTSTATLMFDEEIGTSTQEYNVYYVVYENNYIYTQNELTPELLLKIIDPEGNEIKVLDGYEHKTVIDAAGNTLTGFDVTMHTGTIIIANDYEINANTKEGTTQNWSVTLSFVNLEGNQGLNAEKSLDSKLILQKNDLKVSDVCVGYNINSCLVDNIVLDDYLIQHTSDIIGSANDNNYRYSGSENIVENFVCFGTESTNCDIENLYQILGVYDGTIKIIKNNPIDMNNDGMYRINSNETDTIAFDSTGYYGSNKWEGTDLINSSDDADINVYLNGTYYNNLPVVYQNMILPMKLNIGNISYASGLKPINFYNSEISIKTEHEYNIGLLNPSDYFYAASKEYWNLVYIKNVSPYDAEYYFNQNQISNNWMFLENIGGYYEWALNPKVSTTGYISYIYNRGTASNHLAKGSGGVRPVIYLNQNIIIESGLGTSDNPYRLLTK